MRLLRLVRLDQQADIFCLWCWVLPLSSALLVPPVVNSAGAAVALQPTAAMRPARRRCAEVGPLMAAPSKPSVSKGELLDAIAAKAGVSKKLASQVFTAGR